MDKKQTTATCPKCGELRGQVDRITASADRYKLKEQKKEYLTRAGAQLKHTQIAELEFLLQ